MKKILFGLLPIVLLTGCVPKSDLDKARADLEAAKAQNRQLSEELATTKTMLEQSEAEVAELNPLAAKARQIPIRCRFARPEGAGLRLMVRNLSRTPLKLDIGVNAADKPQAFSPTIEPGRFYLLPADLPPGVSIDVVCSGYDTMTLKAPGKAPPKP